MNIQGIKILLACIPTPTNRYLIDLLDGLKKHATVVWDYTEFWECRNHYDIVHIHWPEYLSFETESYLRNSDPFPEELWTRINRSFLHWSRTSCIVCTRHNFGPHARFDDHFRKLYSLTYSHCKAVFHFADFSIKDFRSTYPEYPSIIHFIVPHHNYSSLPNTIKPEAARKKLGIRKDALVMLVFGTIKDSEKDLIRKAFSCIRVKPKVLLAPGWKINRSKIRWIRLREWVFHIKCFIAKRNKTFRLNKGIVPEEEVQDYCKAANFMLIPRMHELNSGNVALGFTFGLTVVGRNSGNVGEILTKTGNPVFVINSETSLKNALSHCLALTKQGQGEKNKFIAFREWSVENTVFQQLEYYQILIKTKYNVQKA